MIKTFHHAVQIYYEDTDHSGVVYHANFLKYFERAREHVLGGDIINMLWQDKGCGFAVYKANMIFKEGVEFADICDIRTTFKLDGKFKTLWHHEVWRPNAVKPAVIGDIVMVYLDKKKQLKPMPSEIISI
ncbi:MAG: thioesterase [Psychromonas sp.]|nr:thioesterase [Psychromonas sp.]